MTRPRPITLDTDAIEHRVRDALGLCEALAQVSDDPAENAPAHDVQIAAEAREDAVRMCAKLFLGVTAYQFNVIKKARLDERAAQFAADMAAFRERIA